MDRVRDNKCTLQDECTRGSVQSAHAPLVDRHHHDRSLIFDEDDEDSAGKHLALAALNLLSANDRQDDQETAQLADEIADAIINDPFIHNDRESGPCKLEFRKQSYSRTSNRQSVRRMQGEQVEPLERPLQPVEQDSQHIFSPSSAASALQFSRQISYSIHCAMPPSFTSKVTEHERSAASVTCESSKPLELEVIVPESERSPLFNRNSSNGDHVVDRFGRLIYQQQSHGAVDVENGRIIRKKSYTLSTLEGARARGKDVYSRQRSATQAVAQNFISCPTSRVNQSTLKLLLDKLNDVNDNFQLLQERRWVRWWLSNAEDKDGYLDLARQKHNLEFRELVYDSIPQRFRSKVWWSCSGAENIRQPGLYEELLAFRPRSVGDIELQIEMVIEWYRQLCRSLCRQDIHRTNPRNVYFGGKGIGVPKLRRVLLAFCRKNPDVGYCQGMNLIAATCLLAHPTEEMSFWELVALIENILPPDYYSPDLLGSRVDLLLLKQLIKDICPSLHKQFEQLSVDVEAFTFGWFLTLFAECLPTEATFRVWDLLFLDGSVALFRIAVAILLHLRPALLSCETAEEVYAEMHSSKLRMIPADKILRQYSGSLVKKITSRRVDKLRSTVRKKIS